MFLIIRHTLSIQVGTPIIYWTYFNANLKMKFVKTGKIMYWKKVDTHSYTIHVSFNKIKHNYIATFTDYENCMPYVQYNGVRYVTVDRMKFLLYKAVVMSDLMDLLEEHKPNYECICFLICFYLNKTPNEAKRNEELTNSSESLERVKVKKLIKSN